MSRHLRAVLAVLSLVLGGCKGGGGAPRDGGADVGGGGVASMQVTVALASMTEADDPSSEHLRLELAIANTGDVPVEHVGVLSANIGLYGLSFPATFKPDPPPPVPPVAAGETRTLAFQADL